MYGLNVQSNCGSMCSLALPSIKQSSLHAPLYPFHPSPGLL